MLCVVESLGNNTKYLCKVAVAENYPGSNFVSCFFHLSFKEKLKQSALVARSLYKVKAHGKGILHKISSVYFTSSNIITRSFSALPEKAFDNIDLFLLACDDNDLQNEYKSSDYVSELLRRGIGREKIFIIPPVMYRAELPLLEGDELSPLCKNMNEVKPILRYMEYNVTDFCNLRCKGCSHLANYVKELKFGGAENFRLSLAKLAEKFRNIAVIRLLGGEPLLCRELHEYIYAAHEIFPYSQIKIVTNGLLYKNITRETIEAIKRSGAEIQITQYPPTRKIAGEIIAFCEQNGIKLSMSGLVREFNSFALPNRGVNAAKCWLECYRKYCKFLRGTNLYPCPMLWTYSEPSFRDIVKERALNESERREYSYDLSQDVSEDGWDILAKFETPMEICNKCGDKLSFFKWESELPQYNE